MQCFLGKYGRKMGRNEKLVAAVFPDMLCQENVGESLSISCHVGGLFWQGTLLQLFNNLRHFWCRLYQCNIALRFPMIVPCSLLKTVLKTWHWKHTAYFWNSACILAKGQWLKTTLKFATYFLPCSGQKFDANMRTIVLKFGAEKSH